MRPKYRMFRRGAVYWIQDNVTGKQESLGTKDRAEAKRLFDARNEAHRQPLINLQIARAYLSVGDPQVATRTWSYVMDEIVRLKQGETRRRWESAVKDRALAPIRDLVVLETRAEHFLRILKRGKVSSHVYLRRIHNFALDMNWLPCPVLPKKSWPVIKFKEKRGITRDEHQRILAREQNPERRQFYQFAWHLGASQSDIALLEAENVDWATGVISFARKKTGTIAMMRLDDEMLALLRTMPASGPLFPYLRTVRAGDRATEFKQRCTGLGIAGVTLHSYRYAWAERAKTAGYPERFAQEALGHNSKAVHRYYARKALVELPSLSEFERERAPFTSGSPTLIEPVAAPAAA